MFQRFCILTRHSKIQHDWCLIVLLIFIFLMASDVEQFSTGYLLSTYPFLRHFCWTLAICFLHCSFSCCGVSKALVFFRCKFFFFFFLSETWFVNSFLAVNSLSFYSCKSVFYKTKVVSSSEVQFIIFFFFRSCFWCHSEEQFDRAQFMKTFLLCLPFKVLYFLFCIEVSNHCFVTLVSVVKF